MSGLALTFLGTGLARVLGEGLSSSGAITTLPVWTIPGTVRGAGPGADLLHRQSILAYVAYLLVPLAWFWIDRTRPGLHLRAVGEYPAAADAQGIGVYVTRYGYVFVGGLLAGLAGAAITLAVSPGWFGDQTVNGRGWIAIGLVIFAQWSPFRAAFGALLFGAIFRLILDIQGQDDDPLVREPVHGRAVRDILPWDAALPDGHLRGDPRFALGRAQAARGAGGTWTTVCPWRARRLTWPNGGGGVLEPRAKDPRRITLPRATPCRATPSGRSRWCRTRAAAARTASGPHRPARSGRTRR